MRVTFWRGSPGTLVPLDAGVGRFPTSRVRFMDTRPEKKLPRFPPGNGKESLSKAVKEFASNYRGFDTNKVEKSCSTENLKSHPMTLVREGQVLHSGRGVSFPLPTSSRSMVCLVRVSMCTRDLLNNAPFVVRFDRSWTLLLINQMTPVIFTTPAVVIIGQQTKIKEAEFYRQSMLEMHFGILVIRQDMSGVAFRCLVYTATTEQVWWNRHHCSHVWFHSSELMTTHDIR